jgi:hypothetical protein
VHIGEEVWGDFPASIAALTGFTVSATAFLAANVFLWMLMTSSVVWVLRRLFDEWVVVALGVIVVINALLHIGGSIMLAGYSPGLVSGVLLWLTLGAITLAKGYTQLPWRNFSFGVIVGAAIHIMVPVVLLGFVLAFGWLDLDG